MSASFDLSAGDLSFRYLKNLTRRLKNTGSSVLIAISGGSGKTTTVQFTRWKKCHEVEAEKAIMTVQNF